MRYWEKSNIHNEGETDIHRPLGRRVIQEEGWGSWMLFIRTLTSLPSISDILKEIMLSVYSSPEQGTTQVNFIIVVVFKKDALFNW